MIKKGVLLVKKILLGVSSVIMTALIIATVIYYPNSNEIIHPPLDRLNHVQDNQEPQNEPEQPQSEQLQPVNTDDTITYTLRSEEHTSELHSRGHPVCRCMIEKIIDMS